MRRQLILCCLAATAALMVVAATPWLPGSAHAVQLSANETAGCTPARPHASGTSVETITTSDGPRTYRLHVPPSYTGSSALPLVFNIHGATSNATSQEVYSGYSAKADTEGFIVVYPQGLTTSLIPYTHFNAWMLGSPEPDDLGFMATLLDGLEGQLCIDPTRVFSTGISNGAIMSVRLACSLSNRVAAIAPVAGAYYPPDATNINPAEVCPDTTPVPMIAFHGTADTSVPYNGGLGGHSGTTNFRLPIDASAPTENVLGDWSAHNGCTSGRQESQISSEVRLVQYGACTNNAVVELYAVDGGGHTWPGAFDVPSLGYTTHQISATDLSWAFFAAHAMPTAAASVGGIAGVPKRVEPHGAATTASGDHRVSIILSVALGAAAVIGVFGWRLRRRARP